MKLYRNLIAIAISSAALYGCSSSSSGGGDDNGGGGSASCGAGEPSFVSCSNNVYTISGTIDEDYTMTADKTWVLDGFTKVGSGNIEAADAAAVQAIKDAGVVLTIEAGTTINAMDDGVLLVTRGSQLVAVGTAAAPITFASAADTDFDGAGEWGGVVIQGFAPEYGKGDTGPCYGAGTVCNVDGEGGPEIGKFGGNDPADNSGQLRYVRIAEAGLVAGPNNEINGLTLQGVGYGTEIEYIQVHGNLDDGIEWFGGTVSVKHAVLTNNDDDDLDFDEGYKGNIQHVIIRKNPNKAAPTGSNDPRGIEANSSNPEFVSATEAVLANITIIGSDMVVSGSAQPGIRLRGEVNTEIWNSAVSAYNDCIRVDSGDNVFHNFIGGCVSSFLDDKTTGVSVDTSDNVTDRTPDDLIFDSALALSDAAAQLGAPVTITAVNNGDMSFTFDDTDYVGAVDPDTSNPDRDWWSSWIIPGSLQTDTGPSFVSCSGGVCTLSGNIDEDYTMVPWVTWVLDNFTTVGSGNGTVADAAAVQAVKDAGVTLTIQPGTSINAQDDGVLLVTRGSKLMAEGTAEQPITFSSAADADYDGAGEWGGVVIQGFAPEYGKGDTGPCYGTGTVCNVAGEGGTQIGNFGGDDPADDSGVIRYVRIAEAGLVAGPNNEINGLTLQGVGYGTQIDHIQIHGNLDDGIEWFGGTVNVTYAVLTNNDDDDLDFDEGYKGNIQHVIIRKNQTKAAPTGSNDPRGIEANSSSPEYVSDTEAVLANITIIGSDMVVTGSAQPGMRLRGEVNTQIWNSAVSGYSDCIRVDSGDNVFHNFIGACVNAFLDDNTSGVGVDTTDNVNEIAGGTLTFDSLLAVTNAEATAFTAPAEITPVNNGSGFDFEETGYMGAVDPDTGNADRDWYSAWILDGTLD